MLICNGTDVLHGIDWKSDVLLLETVLKGCHDRKPVDEDVSNGGVCGLQTLDRTSEGLRDSQVLDESQLETDPFLGVAVK